MENKVFVMTFDWKAPPHEVINSFVKALNMHGIAVVPVDTGGDCYGVCVAQSPLTHNEAEQLYNKFYDLAAEGRTESYLTRRE